MTNQKSDRSECCILLSGGLFGLSLAVACICYVVFGILYLVQDYNVWNDCESDTNLWPYVLVAIILSLNKANAKNMDDSDAIITLCCGFLLELGLASWGGVELYDKIGNCTDLRESNLWKFGLASFILQLVFCAIVLIIPLIICVANRYSSSKVPTANNNKMDLRVDNNETPKTVSSV
uniref:Transmembrane protein n=1 Tax=viral metagenome TaxID=1070528 RepID=A0A6C0EHS7_9ZZZZ